MWLDNLWNHRGEKITSKGKGFTIKPLKNGRNKMYRWFYRCTINVLHVCFAKTPIWYFWNVNVQHLAAIYLLTFYYTFIQMSGFQMFNYTFVIYSAQNQFAGLYSAISRSRMCNVLHNRLDTTQRPRHDMSATFQTNRSNF